MKKHRRYGSANGASVGCRTKGDRDAHLQSLLEEERSRISREIHDELGQYLTALKFHLFSLAKKIPDDDQMLKAMAVSAIGMVDLLIGSVQSIALKLRPAVLEDLCLAEAIEWQVRQFEASTGIACGLCLESVPLVLAPEIATAIFRILQETLTNVARHAGASRVEVAVKRVDNSIILEAGDNGTGIPAAAVSDPGSLGLSGIRDRLRPLKGAMEIVGKKGSGTRIRARIPLPEGQA